MKSFGLWAYSRLLFRDLRVDLYMGLDKGEREVAEVRKIDCLARGYQFSEVEGGFGDGPFLRGADRDAHDDGALILHHGLSFNANGRIAATIDGGAGLLPAIVDLPVEVGIRTCLDSQPLLEGDGRKCVVELGHGNLLDLFYPFRIARPGDIVPRPNQCRACRQQYD